MMIDGLIGGFSNSFAAILCHPMDVIKTNYQTDMQRGLKRKIPQIAKDIWFNNRTNQLNGIRGFYRGLAPQLATYPVFWSFYHTTNGIFNIKLGSSKFYDNITNSLVSATLSSSITNPLFVIKNNMQTVENPKIGQTIKMLYNQNGYSSFFRGLPATLLNNTKLAIQFPVSDYLRDIQGYNVGISAFWAKLITTSLFYPLDLIRVNQRNTSGLSMKGAIKMIYNNSGFLGFYRGVFIYNCVSTPSFVLMEIFRNYGMNYYKSRKS